MFIAKYLRGKYETFTTSRAHHRSHSRHFTGVRTGFIREGTEKLLTYRHSSYHGNAGMRQ